MLKSCEYGGRLLNFIVPDSYESGANKFTVIVGKNGTGKSRLLRALVKTFVNVIESDERERERAISGMFKPQEIKIPHGPAPSRVIALSTSPFDRFPINNGIDDNEEYQYLGLRGLGNRNLSLSFISSIVSALLSSVVDDPNQAHTVQTVLKYLGYNGFIEARFVTLTRASTLDTLLASSDVGSAISEIRSRNGGMREDRFLYRLNRLSTAELKDAHDALHYWRMTNRRPRLDLVIDGAGVRTRDTAEKLDKSLLPLFKLGFFQLRDIGLQKQHHDSTIRINDASSGEQCVVMALLGIASHIQDGALICIDEPEICLHPEWQERYIQLLMTTFGQFKNCHFVIATHSPQIVAKLQDTNCFVMDLESGITTASSEFNGRSIDFQLARVFKAPGDQNEYLSRVVFNALRLIGSGKKLGTDQVSEVLGILALKDRISTEDPVRQLMEILEESLKEMERE